MTDNNEITKTEERATSPSAAFCWCHQPILIGSHPFMSPALVLQCILDSLGVKSSQEPEEWDRVGCCNIGWSEQPDGAISMRRFNFSGIIYSTIETHEILLQFWWQFHAYEPLSMLLNFLFIFSNISVNLLFFLIEKLQLRQAQIHLVRQSKVSVMQKKYLRKQWRKQWIVQTVPRIQQSEVIMVWDVYLKIQTIIQKTRGLRWCLIYNTSQIASSVWNAEHYKYAHICEYVMVTETYSSYCQYLNMIDLHYLLKFFV